jgi:guanyl-specific ribonuclease Sa
VDSPATIEAMAEWMAKTYGITRLYWRGGQMGIWDSEYKIGADTPLQYDWNRGWVRHLQNDLGINETAVRAAKRQGMEVFLYTGLFEHGVQPDVGIISPYLFEDRLRREHPEWCPVDRWQERRCPGPLCFGYPEVRRALVERYLRSVVGNGYDGMTFYTYVENVGLRHADEFGFNPPIVEEFAKHCHDVDLRRDKLTDEQKAIWYRCRGKFVTDFLRDLHTALAKQGRKLSIILDAKNPDHPQPWWGKKAPGTGLIHMDWRAWIEQGIVDELWVQLGATADQQALLDELLRLCRGKPIRLVVRTPDPFSATWNRYVAAGVTPVAVVTAPRNGIERLTLDPIGPDSLCSADWRQRAQAADDAAAGKLRVPAKAIAPLSRDPHVLVRRKSMYALAALQATAHVAEIEAGLFDSESSVRIAAAAALATVHGSDSAQKLLTALERDGYFQFKEACIDGLAGMKEKALPASLTGLKSAVPAVREVCVRALYQLGKGGLAREVWEPLRAALLDAGTDWQVRYWAVDGLVGLRLEATIAQQQQFGADLLMILDSPAPTGLQLHAAWGLGYLAGLLPAAQADAVRGCLARLFRQFGDGCTRSDAAFGWRVVGNALMQSGQPGVDLLEAMRQQRKDKWLAWIAYEVVHVPQKSPDMIIVPESEAVAAHDRHAPPFPGIRPW